MEPDKGDTSAFKHDPRYGKGLFMANISHGDHLCGLGRKTVKKRGGLYKENFIPKNQIAYDATIPDAPEDMKCFYIVDPELHDWDYYIYQMEAYEIAANKHYKTINGHSGQAPDEWALWSPEWPDYEEMVKSWIEINGLDHVYAYDRTNRIWIPWEERNAELNEIR